ncbi:BAG-associated GRAM protein 1 [Camellia lanceoleosa]|uniref:BAG-associated GRAM protein 1 n=1 Tax=Camellia lanceoleosa TaxID=1840588 RepID=A0ACC0FZE4_9ERIC|nr:BAG-associated GRAM protein 1 [Camellia lanceoleosa]
MCPPDIAMTEWQHAVLSPDKKQLVFETIQQTHDVPFGSYFEASQASLEWLMKKRKAFDRQGDMVVTAWAEQQQQHEMNLRVRRLSRSKVGKHYIWTCRLG